MKRFFLVPFGLLLIVLVTPMPQQAFNNPEPPARSANELYQKYCATCHGRDGRANSLKAKLKHARNLTDAEWQNNVTDERIFNSIINGKGKMPGFSKKISEQETDSLVTYVRALRR